MFCVVYEFLVKCDQQDYFQKYWQQMTLEIKKKYHGLGSRLHKKIGADNQWIAYAQWSSREAWLSFKQVIPNDANITLLSEKMRNTCHSSRVVYELEVADDLLETVE